jgi:hypothetical protein
LLQLKIHAPSAPAIAPVGHGLCLPLPHPVGVPLTRGDEAVHHGRVHSGGQGVPRVSEPPGKVGEDPRAGVVGVDLLRRRGELGLSVAVGHARLRAVRAALLADELLQRDERPRRHERGLC